jgi:hypothetical protein
MPDLQSLDFGKNSLSGAIPAELGNLNYLLDLNLSGNKLSGEIPFSLTNMDRLDPTNTDIGYNALTATDATLISFLNNKDWDWAATQTIAPAGVSAASQSSTSVLVSWAPIPYTGDSGGYTVYYSRTSGGLYNTAGNTTDKAASAFLVNSLAPGTQYFFVVSAFTNPHGANANTLLSSHSQEVSAVTLREVQNWKSGSAYKVGDYVKYSGKTWKCVYAHTAQANWYPGAPGLWFWTLADYDGQWHSGVAYKVGDLVTYNNQTWQCTFAHTSQANWYPGAPGIWFWKKI